jgi:hypothetical protein
VKNLKSVQRENMQNSLAIYTTQLYHGSLIFVLWPCTDVTTTVTTTYIILQEPGDVVPDGSEDIPIDGPNYPTTRSPNLSKNNREPPPMQRSPSASFFAQPGTLAGNIIKLCLEID